jgi:hypothetical protein
VTDGNLPQDGELRLGSAQLASGRRITPVWGTDPVAWGTDEPVQDVATLWLALSAMAAQTGLQPVRLIDPDPEDVFGDPPDVAQLDDMDAAAILKEWWDGKASPDFAEYAPFSREFPGLAPGPDSKVTADEARRTLESLGPAPLGLVGASRPADVLAKVGWLATDHFDDALPLAAVLRSWEDRFGARLVQIGPSAEIRLLVERPPRTAEAALAVAAEHWAFSDAWIDEQDGPRIDLTSVSEIVPRVINAPLWGFWWD